MPVHLDYTNGSKLLPSRCTYSKRVYEISRYSYSSDFALLQLLAIVYNQGEFGGTTKLAS